MHSRPNIVITVALALNLLLGSAVIALFCLREITDGNSDSTTGVLSMALCYSLAAMLLLLGGFRRIRPAWNGAAAALWGVFCTALVPVIGGGLWAVALMIGWSALYEVPVTFLKGCIFGLFGSPLAVPFALGNALAFFLYLKLIRKTLPGGGGAFGRA